MAAFLLRSLLSDPSFTEAYGFWSSKTGPSMDWKETPEAHIFKFDIPGRAKEDVKIQVHDDRVLHISAVSKEDQEEDYKSNYKWHCKERVDAGISFCREFRLPENALVDEIKASMSDGVLTVTVAKDRNKHKHQKHVKKHAVEIAGEGEDSGSATKGLGRFVCCKA